MSDIINMESAVRGCWLGKNIGGTLGAPFEGQRTLQNVSFYVQLEVTTDDRAFPTIISVPFRRKGSVNYPRFTAEDSVEVYNMIARSGK